MKYTGENTKEILFPLGGIGSGSISLTGNGRLVDWEIFNRPSKGSINGYTHFAVKAIKNGKPITFALNGDFTGGLIGDYRKKAFTGYGFGPIQESMCGFPHFRNVEFDGEFPMATLTFTDDNFPADVKMTAFNPFIPNDADSSSIPAGFFDIEVSNTDAEEITYQIAFSVANPYEVSRNTDSSKGKLTALTLANGGVGKGDVTYGDLSVATDCETAYIQTHWYRGIWIDHIISFWNDFNTTEPLKARNYDTDGSFDTGTIVAEITVAPRETKNVRFILSWNVPNNYNYWSEHKNHDGTHKSWKNYYATMFADSLASAEYSLKNWDELYNKTKLFTDTLHGSSLPQDVIDAASANLSVLKSPTVLRLEDGSFYGWEGVNELEGSCEGTCQHVWNYAYAMCFLFPELERSIRDTEFKYSTDEHGRMCFRTALPLGSEMLDYRHCVDGQMGAVIKCYREWKISGDNDWLKSKWDDIKKVLEYAWSDHNTDRWDADKDGVLEGRQHHTLDKELFGPSSWLEGFYLTALKAASEMAEFLGDTHKAEEYRALFEKGYKWTKENLFNGKYFFHKIDVTDKSIVERFDAADEYWNDETGEIKYQIAEGSIIDQVLAQWHSDILGLGEIFDKSQLDSALSFMMANNFKSSMRDVINLWRVFSLDDEAGTIICSYPDGVTKPKISVPYCEETMTGFEYSFAGLLCSQGRIDDGLKVVKAVRDRFRGHNRNPWNEFECGNNYARSMASYALIPILLGFEFDMPKGYMGFNPYKKDGFKCIWSIDGSWGYVEVNEDKITLKILGGELSIKALGLKFIKGAKTLTADGREIGFDFSDGVLGFDRVSVRDCIEVTL